MSSLIDQILAPLQYSSGSDESSHDMMYSNELWQHMALDVDMLPDLMLDNNGMLDIMFDAKLGPEMTLDDNALQQMLVDGLTMLPPPPPPPPAATSLEEQQQQQQPCISLGETETEAISMGSHASPTFSSSELVLEPPSSVLPPSPPYEDDESWSVFHHARCQGATSDNDNNGEAALVLPREQPDRVSQPAAPEALIRSRGDEYTVIIMSGRVAQKSYGTEKRYLSPPPTILVFGAQKQHPALVTTASCCITTPGESGPVRHETFYPEQDRCLKCVSKQLHIAERRKQISVTVDIPHLGKFVSKPIKVISKPSKKKQNSAKHPELYVQHGSTIALFNRIHSQTVSTRYLGVNLDKSTSELAFSARPSTWDPFLIWIVDSHITGGVLRYNQRVVLQCVRTGLLSPVMVIRRRHQQHQQQRRTAAGPAWPAVHDDNEPVSQLHRITLELAERPSHYLTCINDTVMTAAAATVNDDQAIWTIVGTEFATYTFWKPPASRAVVASPFPEISRVEAHGDRIVFTGADLHDDSLSIWLGDVLCQPMESSSTSRTCRLPPPSSLLASRSLVIGDDETCRLPILLTRHGEDIVYGSGHHYTI